MEEKDELYLKLKAIGLTVYEIKTYKALIKQPETNLTADDIHKITKIPTPRIYDTIDSLSDKGLVRIISGRPKRFRVLQPVEGFSIFLDRKKEEFSTEFEHLKKQVSEITALLGEIRINPEELLEAYSSLEEMEIKTIEIINSATKSIEIFTNVFYWFDKVDQVLKDAIARNVEIRVIMTTDDEKARKIARDLSKIGVSVKHIEEESVLVRGTLVDYDQVVFVIWVSPKTEEKYIYRPHFSSNPGIIELFANNFEYLWSKAKEFS
ncbi:MAG: TrmB family transcriptional regulator [Candidatus Heimdallarchaeaceae archaeon]